MGEYITNIDGRSGDYVDRLTITTTPDTYGPYGGDGGSSWSAAVTNVGGFVGSSGSYLDLVGFYTACAGSVAG